MSTENRLGRQVLLAAQEGDEGNGEELRLERAFQLCFGTAFALILLIAMLLWFAPPGAAPDNGSGNGSGEFYGWQI